MDVVRMYRCGEWCCCKEVYIGILIIIITFPYSACFSGNSIPTSLFILKMFFQSFIITTTYF